MMHAQAPGTENPSELVRRILAGERSAEGELVDRYRTGVSIVIRRIVRNPYSTEDLCQEAFRLIVEKVRRGDLREPEKLSGFVCSLARNLAIDHLRRIRPVVALEEAETTFSISDPAPDQLNHLLQKEIAESVRKVLNEMTSDRDRAVLYRFYIAEEDKERICADLGLSSVHFNRVLHRARERFGELYKKKTQ